jgi:hypothetical protein
MSALKSIVLLCVIWSLSACGTKDDSEEIRKVKIQAQEEEDSVNNSGYSEENNEIQNQEAYVIESTQYTNSGYGTKNDWAEGAVTVGSGATRVYYNAAAFLKWENSLGDWRDVNGIPQGSDPYVTARVQDTNTGRYVEWDVSNLVDEWVREQHQNQGFFLRSVGKGGNIKFASRESKKQNVAPELTIVIDGKTLVISPEADTYLSNSSHSSMGNRDTLVLKSGSPVLIRFDLTPINVIGPITQATLRLYTTQQFGHADIGVFRSQQGYELLDEKPIYGLAAKFPGDYRISQDPDVIFFTDFESWDWESEWSNIIQVSKLETVTEDLEHEFSPLREKALKVRIAKGKKAALNTYYKFTDEELPEPEEIYFRYYLRLGNDWNQTRDVGKLPGISGTYRVAGWGGRTSDGTNGWSARGYFPHSIPKDNPLGGLHPVGSYFYHADMQTKYGDPYVWNHSYGGFLENNRWYSIEQHLKLNTSGQKDGVFRAWVDGRLVFEKNDIRFRNISSLKIEQIWMNVYHGGTRPSPYDQHMYIDNVVIANKYIGPMK